MLSTATGLARAFAIVIQMVSDLMFIIQTLSSSLQQAQSEQAQTMLSTAAGLARAFAIVIRMVSDLMSMVTEEDSYAAHAPSLACVLQVTASRDLPMLQSFLERRLGMLWVLGRSGGVVGWLWLLEGLDFFQDHRRFSEHLYKIW